jgi:AraC family transcriptional regulator
MGTFQKWNMEILPSGKENSLFDERETQMHHSPYQWEQLLIGYIRDGNLPMIERFINMSAQSESRIGKLSDNELRQAQYLAVILAYQASRAAIQSGMFEADALNRSDAFIQKIDKETSPQAVIELIQEAMRDWTKAVHEIRTRQHISAPIRACLEYIYEHLHSRITLEELAKVSGFSVPYLSALFKKEVGESISEYLLSLKIKTAQEMLLNTKHSTKDIGFYLNFCSQSYFIRCFKKITGVTPQEFRHKRISPKNQVV